MYSIGNAVTAALIAGALIVMVIMTLTDSLFPAEENTALAYTIEVASEAGAADVAMAEGPSLEELLAGASVDKGQRQFAKCRACHSVDKGGRNGAGPNLYGIVGRAVASAEGFRYSAALKEKGGVWDLALLDAWIESPKAAVPGNIMSFAGLRKPQQRADLIAYLNTLSDNPMPLGGADDAGEAPATMGMAAPK